EREVKEDENGEDGDADRQEQRARCALLALDPSAYVDEVARRQFELTFQSLTNLASGPAEVTPFDARLDCDAAAARLAANRARPERLFDRCELIERDARAVVP